MKKKLFLLILVLVLMIPVVTSAQEQPIKLVVHGNNVETDVAPLPVATNTNIQSIVGSGGTNVTESEPIEGQYIGNKNTGVFHYPGCSSVKKMSAKNKVSISSRDNAINGGYRPCQICKP